MKILLLKKDITDQDTISKGLTMAQNLCQTIGLPLNFTEQNFINPLRSIPFSNSTNKNGYMVDPASFLGTWNIGYDSVLLIYDSTKVNPEPTNPSDFGATMEIPINWYSTFPDVLAEFILHELCHQFFALTGKPDITHNYDPAFGQKPRTDWYLYLLKGMLPLTPFGAPTGLVATLTRGVQTSKETLGTLTAKNGSATFNCKTLELPYIGNQANISCIPKGTYQVKWTRSLKFPLGKYEIQNIPQRSGVRIHSANFYSDLKGCIALGNTLADINKDSQLDILNSQATVSLFENFMQKRSFTLIIN